MKNKYKLILAAITTLFGVVSIANPIITNAGDNDKVGQSNYLPATKYWSVNDDVESFYTSTSSGSVKGLKGDELLEKLAEILEDNHKYYNTYGELRSGMAYSDEDPNDTSKLIYFYSGVSASNNWGSGSVYNREHVWCKANSSELFKTIGNDGRGAGADIHHLRPEDAQVNSDRSNFRFANLNKSGTQLTYNNEKIDCYINSSNRTFDPRDSVKGDCARILMYMYTHYSTEVSENSDRSGYTDSSTVSKSGALDITNMVYTSSGTKQSAWDLLVEWNELDPVDEFEMNRNDYCTAVTGVRNPFIDHPEFASMIWDKSYTGNGALNDEGENETPTPDSEEPSVDPTPTPDPEEPEVTTKAYTLITDVNQLKVGSKVVIAAANSNYAMSTSQVNTYYRGATSITKNGDGTLGELSSSVQEFVLENGVNSGTYSFFTGSNYIAATSSSYNNLQTENTKTGNSSFKVTISNGTTKIVATGSNTRNDIRYLSSYNDFGCCSTTSSESNVVIYQLVEEETPEVPTITYNETLQSLVKSYYNNGVYQKKTDINFNEATVKELNQYFHTGNIPLLSRTTYFNGNTLLMGDIEGTFNNVNSGYGTVTSSNKTKVEKDVGHSVNVGDMTHYTLNDDGTTVTYNYTVSYSSNFEDYGYEEKGMEAYYTTLHNLSNNYFVSNDWIYDASVGYYHNITNKSTDKYLQDFLDITAPLLLNTIYNAGNYFTLDKLVVKEENGHLKLQILIDTTNSGVTTNNTTILSEARIYSNITPFNEKQETVTKTIVKSVTELKTEYGWTNATAYRSFNLDDNVSVTASSDGDNGKYYTTGNNYRLYQSNSGTITFTVGSNYELVSIKITYSSSNSGVLKYNNNNVLSNVSLAVSGSSVTLSVGNTGSATNGQARITNFEIVYKTK